MGTTTIVWTATDDQDQSNSCQQLVTVNVTGAALPTVTAPPDVVVNTGPNSGSCTVLVEEAAIGDAAATGCSSSITRTGVPQDNLFPVGVTTITWKATDAAGNTATDTQTVTVVDNTPPVVTAPAGTSASASSSCQAAIPNVVVGSTATDNCTTSPVITQSPAAGTPVGLGTHVITVTATDASGNHGTAVTSFTVTDDTPPTIIAPPNVLAGTDPTSCSATNVALGTPQTADNCTVASVTNNAPAAFPKGTTVVTWTVTDGAGHTASATQNVTVVDNTPPLISCPSDILVGFNPAVAGAVVTYSTPVGSDNCAGASTAQTNGLASGATFPLGTTTNTFKVTDASGNTASCSFTVTVALTSIVGLDSVSITGAGPVDSYDSAGGYPATKGSLASVVSNGNITMSGSAKVSGSVRSTQGGVVMSGASQVTGNATAATTVSRTGSASVGGTITNNSPAPAVSLAAVPACGPPYSSTSGISGTYSYSNSTGDLNLTGVNVATLANGTYCFHNVSVGNSAQLRVNGQVTMRLTGTLSVGGAAVVNNTTTIPGNLRILSSYTGSNGVVISNGSSAYLMIYAPRTNVTISGAAPLYGTVAGKTLTISNSGTLHYDTRLQTIWPDIWQLIF